MTKTSTVASAITVSLALSLALTNIAACTGERDDGPATTAEGRTEAASPQASAAKPKDDANSRAAQLPATEASPALHDGALAGTTAVLELDGVAAQLDIPSTVALNYDAPLFVAVFLTSLHGALG